MSYPATSRFGLLTPDYTDGPAGADVPYWMRDMALKLDTAAIDAQGTIGNRPVSTVQQPGKAGRYYTTTDEVGGRRTYRDHGAGWDELVLSPHNSERLKIIRGSFRGDTLAILNGSGFSVTRRSGIVAGAYTVTFSAGYFSGQPAVTPAASASSGAIAAVLRGVVTDSFNVDTFTTTNGGNIDTTVLFIAIGPS